ncbi:hypothetical protein PTTG_04717 [Puccinia triticina 1-1 BBBD Race 1]|uniref:GPI ethanolamine phosphate transferase 1 n=3 Tax=Puccinia triticina TaxID=208348 RepID=A0A180GGW0_PUCT1|nr:uncharacterized protein PtA15_1A382 [Puccinia triticina]OAV91203.1 hypothetical protein PTTG_04717 [Puccinia triticina 1-1 BBBD Race 1]WAQ81044.1 hypothetical protein PtA15_1A382 [Puccinia triticina]
MITSRAFGGPAWLLSIGFVFHAVYLMSIFDVYFISPVVRVPQRFSPLDPIQGEPPASRVHAKPLASRVVLIVGDGLRADKLFSLFPNPPFYPSLPVPILPDLKPIPISEEDRVHGNQITPAPYLRALIETGEASWGVSHTRVPTESRPGHVAIIAGMYEDVSAVTRGWKMNPVNFDSVFNQSSHSFTFGSPDILPMFKHGASDPSRVDAWSYDEAAEDFTKDAAQLDIWVLERLRRLLSDAKRAGPGSSLDRQLNSDQVFFFLHLLGLDTTGHSYRPHSPEYFRNIQVVDQVVRGTQELLENFYGDDRTAFIFTADHGMSNIGNHGDGDPDNTRTPLVAWGSGIQKSMEGTPFVDDGSLKLDPYYQNWNLNMTQRKDVEQADIAALMAALAGIHVPSNSVGRLPLDYLNGSRTELARATYANTREILHQYQTKHELKASTKFAFRSFPGLPDQETLNKPSISERLFLIHRMIITDRNDEAIRACSELQTLALQGLKYLQRYDWFRLRTIIVIGYVGWMVYTAIFVLRTYIISPSPRDHVRFGSIFGAVVFAVTSLYFYLEHSPITYYLYVFFPAYFWGQIIDDVDTLQDLVDWTSSSSSSPTRIWATILATLMSLEFMVLGYFHRMAWTIGWIVIGVIWPTLALSSRFKEENRSLLKAWAIASIFTSLFTILPVEKGESILVIAIGGLAFLYAGYIIRRKYGSPSRSQLALISITLLVTIDSTRRLQQKQGLPLVNQALGWLLLASSILPLLPRRSKPSCETQDSLLTSRLVEIVFAYAPVFIILSLSYEALFYLAFAGSLLIWLEVEIQLTRFDESQEKSAKERESRSGVGKSTGPISKFRLHHSRLSLFYLFFIHVGFFGTGNVGSISSFYLEPVYRLVPIFNPFLMSSLLLFKILIPFLIVSSVFSTLNFRLGLPKFSLFVSSLTITDLMSLNFFFLVNDVGSWLEIGQSISHFAISSLLLVFMILLHFLGDFLLLDLVSTHHSSISPKSKSH